MRALLRSELLKQRSTRTSLALSAAMVGLILLAVLLHCFGLPPEDLRNNSSQLMVLGRGEFLGVLFAALLGAMSVTSEVRYGTIRPTFLVTPRRGRTIAAKALVCAVIGAGLGLVAGGIAAGAGTAALSVRGIAVLLDARDYVLLVVGSAIAAGLWAAIGVGVGAVVRGQVPTLTGICAWLLFVEGLLIGDVGGLGDVGRFLPGAVAAAISGQGADTPVAPAVGLLLLGFYAGAAIFVGSVVISRQDVA